MSEEVKEEATETTPTVDREMVERYKELTSIMKEFRKTLGPRKEAIFQIAAETFDFDEINDLIEVGGGESLSITGKIEGKPMTIMFRSKEDAK